MPRSARVVLPGYPHHLIQRGHNRGPVFVEEADFRFYLATLSRFKSELGCKLYAYCLMLNHVHLVVDPGDGSKSLALLMKRVAGRYTRYVNAKEERTGTVWNGRFKSSPIETDLYLLACCRYVELNPVRANIVGSPEAYRWSSYRAKIGKVQCSWLDEDPCYARLGETRTEREVRYSGWVGSAVPVGEWDLLRASVQRGQLSGSERFREVIENRIGRRMNRRGPGRPRNK